MSLDTMEWIRGNLSSNSSFAVDSVNWDLQFGAILWSLWRRCNAMIFDPENLDMFDVSDRSIWLWKDMQSAYVLKGQDRPNHASRADSLQSSRGSLQSSRAVARWVLPPRDWCKMNVDGARDHRTGLAACGGLIRDHEGRWVRGFARSVGVCSPIESELWAVHEGLVQAWALGLRRVVVEVDSLTVLRLMLHRNGTEVPMTIVLHIFELLNRDWLIKFVHVYREANAVADRLAKSVPLGSLEFRVFVDPPSFITSLLQVDCRADG
ncbi:hypothetical protein V6N13_094451 [Hibiscus sabdariffa]